MAEQASQKQAGSIALVSDYVPRRCGIATFTADLCEALAEVTAPDGDVFVVAVNDTLEGYPYPPRVRFEIRQSFQVDYRLAAEFLNVQQVSAVCVQHEFGIYGGSYGSNILGTLARIRRPLIVTLHTVLKSPDEHQLHVMQQIGQLADRLVVMAEMAHDFLRDLYNVPAEKIVTVPHGIPDVPFVDPNFYKDQFGVEGRKVMLTFGLLSPGKGIEYGIEALPRIVAKHPDVVYIILGATHPHVLRNSGEEYRSSLVRRAEQLGVVQNVQFQNRFVELGELLEFLGAADVYLTPYLNEQQIVSGTLAYALGTGKAVVSTPYWYATEMLAEGRGRIVPFRDANAIADQVIDLLDNEVERHAMRKRAYSFSRKMVWKNVAQQYIGLFEQARQTWPTRRHPSMIIPGRHMERRDDLPEVDLRHLLNLTDRTGMMQHCVCSTPDRRFGYCTDDNARALIVATMQWDQTHDEKMVPLMQTYLAFLLHGLDEKTGRFRNFMNFDRSWSEVIGSEDSHARALWGLGVAVAMCPQESLTTLATRLFVRALPAADSFSSPRAWAFTISGIHAYLRRFSGDSEVKRYRAVLTERLAQRFIDHMSDEWPWCEDTVTYDNARLPHALLMSGKWMNRGDWIEVGKKALGWLVQVQTSQTGMLSIIGTQGWYTRNGPRAQFDQQPVEAHAMVEACIEAFHVTGDLYWAQQASKAFNWFLGDNDLQIPLYDFTTGGCHDGLQVDRINENQGAESTLAWLMALLLMHDFYMEQALGKLPATELIEHQAAVGLSTQMTPAK